jgi:hypothetical protein
LGLKSVHRGRQQQWEDHDITVRGKGSADHTNNRVPSAA